MKAWIRYKNTEYKHRNLTKCSLPIVSSISFNSTFNLLSLFHSTLRWVFVLERVKVAIDVPLERTTNNMQATRELYFMDSISAEHLIDRVRHRRRRRRISRKPIVAVTINCIHPVLQFQNNLCVWISSCQMSRVSNGNFCIIWHVYN